MPDQDLSDEELRKLWKPQVSEADAYRVLDESYVPKGSQRCIRRPLDSYDDVNFEVEIDGTPYLLKVHNGVESENYLNVLEASGGDHFREGHQSSVIHLQTALMQVLHAHRIPASVPQPPHKTEAASSNKNEWPTQVPVSVHKLPVVDKSTATKKLVVRLLSWTKGLPMSSFRVLPAECLLESGQALGKIALAFDQVLPTMTMTTTDNPATTSCYMDSSLRTPARRYHQWDGQNTADLKNFVQYIKDERRLKMIESIIQRFSTDIIESGDAQNFRKGVLHGDFNDANILLNEADYSFSGVIDFGDSVESWRVLDVTIAMAYSMLSIYGKSNRSISAAANVLRGFHSIYPLTQVERKHLVLLMACRLACSVTLGAYSYQQNPGNKYLLLHAEPAWTALELVWGYEDGTDRRRSMAAALQQVFDRACDNVCKSSESVDISDLCFPDPSIFDTLQGIRTKALAPDTKELSPSLKKPKVTKDVTFVTGNKKKLEEVVRILRFDDTSPFCLKNFKLDLPELQGDPVDIAKEKCRLAATEINGPVITEDTSLCFNALDGLPGPYIKWFLDKCGHDGLNGMLTGFDDKTGYAQTVVAFCAGPGQDPIVFDGRTEGTVVPARGSLDFGWDPIFQPHEGNDKTYAEMSKDEKDAISHRSRAFAQLRTYLASL